MAPLPKKDEAKYGEKALNDTFSIRLFVWKYIKYSIPTDNKPYFKSPLEQE